jgi:glycosyltransferase involved in cell wall biosynthesis
MDLSIVIPVFNEAENLGTLHQQIMGVLKSFEGTSEVLVVDDGSTDGTFSMLEKMHQKDPSFGVIRLSRNFGQTAALAAGISYAQGEIIVTLDGDLQNDPEDIPRLVAKLKEGYDLVSGWRLNRKEPFLTRRLPSLIANRLISLTTKVELHDYGCTLKAFRRELAKSLHLYGEMHRFIPALASDLGAAITEIPVNDRPRFNGNSKYGLSRTVRVFLDLVTVKFLSKYLTRPIHVFGFAGLLSTLTGSALLVYLAIQRLFSDVALTNRPLLLLGILLAVMGVQFITMGLLGEMIARIYHETQGKPIFLERQVLISNGGPTIRGWPTERALLLQRYNRPKAEALT